MITITVYWNATKSTKYVVDYIDGYGLNPNYLWIKLESSKTIYIPWHSINRFIVERT